MCVDRSGLKFFGSRKDKSPDKKDKRASEIVADEVRGVKTYSIITQCIIMFVKS